VNAWGSVKSSREFFSVQNVAFYSKSVFMNFNKFIQIISLPHSKLLELNLTINTVDELLEQDRLGSIEKEYFNRYRMNEQEISAIDDLMLHALSERYYASQ
jgi:hypothetical protein